MPIDETGKWWKGESFEDLAEYLRRLTEQSYPADVVKQVTCDGCSGDQFVLRARRDEGAAKAVCAACSTQKFLADSADSFGRAKGATWICPCGGSTANLGVAFSLRESGDVRWITVGQRCVACGVLAAFVDWGVNFAPSADLVDRV